MRKVIVFTMMLALMLVYTGMAFAETPKVKLGNEVLMSKYHHLIKGKNVGLITNQSGVTSQGVSMVDVLSNDQSVNLIALYCPEHGIDGIAKAGEYVESYVHSRLGIPVYSLYGQTRMPTRDMLRNIDVLLFDMQDIGARSYTYMSTLNYCMVAAQQYGKPIVVLDRPNPVGGVIVEGPMLEDRFKTFVGVDNLPMAHGMTAGELANFFNRNIGANLTVIPMESYNRNMLFQDTGLKWVQTSPNIPDLDSVFGYMTTGLGEGTGIAQADKFKWIGGKGVDAQKYADLLNQAGLPGVTFIPEQRGDAGGVRLNIFNHHVYNPAKTGIYALTYAHSLTKFKVPKSGQTTQSIVMFDKIMGTDKIGQYLEQGLTPQQIEAKYATELNRFKEERKKYLIYGPLPGHYDQKTNITVKVVGKAIQFDANPYIDNNNRVMVPLRAIVEELRAQVNYNDETRVININKQGKVTLFTLNSPLVMVNGEQQIMDTSPVVKNSRTMVPLRYVGEYLGLKVNWHPETQTVNID